MEQNAQLRRITQGDIPAPATLEFIQKMNIEMAEIKKDVESICDKLDQNTEDHRIIFDKLDKFIESTDKRYASKNVEKVLWSGGGLIGAALIYAILSLILK